MTDDELKNLLEKAQEAQAKAYAPYSKYKVGAALLADSGKIYQAGNIENASYGATVCAEQVVLFKAYSEGERKFLKMAIAATGDPVPFPCGTCRQILWELAGDLEIVLKEGEKMTQYQLSELFPNPFSGKA